MHFLSKIQSFHNQFFLGIRNSLAFTRGDYYSQPFNTELYQTWLQSFAGNATQKLEEKFTFFELRKNLDLQTYQKNLATLWILEQFFKTPLPKHNSILEVGCQDFSRLPAIAKYFPATTITGIELDAFPILRGAFSRFDRARYYCQLIPRSRYVAADFFIWQNPAHIILVFYPFVSINPALKWGLPACYGNAKAWISSTLKNLYPDGYALYVHQGEWEEEVFDEARKKIDPQNKLHLIDRKILDCPFYPTPYPAHASLYLRK